MLYFIQWLQSWLIKFFEVDELDEIIYDVDDEIRYK